MLTWVHFLPAGQAEGNVLEGATVASVTNPTPFTDCRARGKAGCPGADTSRSPNTTQLQTEALPPRPAPTSPTTRISTRTRLWHKYILATPAQSPVVQLGNADICAHPTAEKCTVASTPHVCHSLLHRYPLLTSTTQVSSQIQRHASSQRLYNTCVLTRAGHSPQICTGPRTLSQAPHLP